MNRALPILSNTACRQTAAPTLRSSLRRTYATAPPAKSGSNSTLLLGLGALAVGGGGYYFLSGGKGIAPEDVQKAQNAVASAVGAGSGAPAALTMKEWRDFKLTEVKPYNHNTSTFIFELPPGHDSGLTVASAILTRSSKTEGEGAALDDKGKPALRPYTPVTAPNVTDKLELLVKKYEKGLVSSHIHSLKPGDTLAMKGPLPKFPYKSNEFEQIVLIGGGSGLTPLWQVLQKIDSDSSDKTKATLIYSNVSEKDILLKEQLDDLAKRKPDQFNIQYVIDKPTKGWKGKTGYITEELLKEQLPLPALADKIKIFVCGPPGQVEAISGNKVSPKDQGPLKGALADMGYQPDQVYKF